MEFFYVKSSFDQENGIQEPMLLLVKEWTLSLTHDTEIVSIFILIYLKRKQQILILKNQILTFKKNFRKFF